VVASTAFVSGASIGVFGPLWDTTMQSQLPPEVLSRASAYDWFGSMVFLPLGFALAGTLARLLGIDGALYLGAGWLVLTVAIVVSLPGVTSLVSVVPSSADPDARSGAGPTIDGGAHVAKGHEPFH
jgi:hypothetical protein